MTYKMRERNFPLPRGLYQSKISISLPLALTAAEVVVPYGHKRTTIVGADDSVRPWQAAHNPA